MAASTNASERTSSFDGIRSFDTEVRDRFGSRNFSTKKFEVSSTIVKPPIIEEATQAELTAVEAFNVDVDGDQSPFPEVAAAVPNTDDPTMVCSTFRSWSLMSIFVILFAGANQFFGLRYPSLSLTYVVAQILVFPVGRAWQRLPQWRIPLGPLSFDLNPGNFTVKEHAFIVICVNISVSAAYGMGALVAVISPEYWGRDYGPAFSFLFVLTSQMLGFGLAGMCRRWLVYPAALIWPNSLSSTVMFRALHEEEDKTSSNGWTMSRYRFFVYFLVVGFILFWFPDYIWKSLSAFAFITWIAPKNQVLNTLFGMHSGLGMLPLSLDWTEINFAGFPLTTPFYVTCNAFAVIVVFYLFLSPIMYYKNVWLSGYLPILSGDTFDNTGNFYNVTKVIDENLDFIPEKYEAYSPLYISITYVITYALSFASVTAIFVHMFLYHGKEIWSKWKNSRSGGEDIHKRLMNVYPEVPDWWYILLTVIVLGLSIFTTRYWDTQLPIWGFIAVCFGMGVILILPEGILQGTTNQRVYLNTITELIAGYAWPGKPIANIMVKCYGYNSVKHGMDFAQDLKLGQYMKIPPRVLFFGQIYASLLATATQTVVLRWMLGNIPKLCSPDNAQRFTCNVPKTWYSASNIWGTIGPERMFGAGQLYNGIMYFFIIGPVVTVAVYFAYKRWPQSLLRYVNVPIFFNASGNIPPATTTQYSLWFIVGFIFNYYIRKHAYRWWFKYNYLLQAALDTGTAIATIVIFFALCYHNVDLNWWGNTVGSNTYDQTSEPWLKVANGTHFGPGPGGF